jgi:hypothetical protein
MVAHDQGLGNVVGRGSLLMMPVSVDGSSRQRRGSLFTDLGRVQGTRVAESGLGVV